MHRVRHETIGVSHETIAIATAVPAKTFAWAAERAGAHGLGQRIKSWFEGIPAGTDLLTTLLWLLIIWGGVLYPISGDAAHAALGGPTLAGAWAVHLATTLGVLLVASLLRALTHRRAHELANELTQRQRLLGSSR
jgi:hypothetical protein